MPSDKKFSIGEAVGFGWETFKKNYLLFIALAAIDLIISGLPNFKLEIAKNVSSTINPVIWLLEELVQIGVITIVLKVIDSKKTDLGDMFENIRLYWRYLSGTLLYGLIVFIGFILLIVPGVIWAIKYQFYGYLIIDKKMKPMDALRKSAEITEGERWNLFILGFALFGVILLGVLALGIGIFAALPVVWIAVAFIYRKLLKSTKASKEEIETAPAE